MKSPIKKLTNFFEEFLSLFEEEEEVPEFEVPEKWKGKKPKPETKIAPPKKQTGKLILKSKKQTSKLILKSPSPAPLPKKYKIKVPYLRKTKKYLAAILFLVNGVIGLLSLFFQPVLGFIFLGNAFILLDYLWKVRRNKT